MQGSAWSVSELTDARQGLECVRVNGCKAVLEVHISSTYLFSHPQGSS